MQKLTKNAAPQDRDARFVRACAVQTHMGMSQEPFYAEICRENAGRPGYHLDWTPGPTPDRKNSKCKTSTVYGYRIQH